MAQLKALVVHYSRTGTTRKLAKAIAEALACENEEIVDPTIRGGIAGYWRSLRESRRHDAANIFPAKLRPSRYDLVIIGTPVWAWSVSSPVRAYLIANKGSFPDVAFFCTMGGSGAASTFREMERVAGKRPRAVLAVPAREMDAGTYGERLAEFAKAVNLQQPDKPPIVRTAA